MGTGAGAMEKTVKKLSDYKLIKGDLDVIEACFRDAKGNTKESILACMSSSCGHTAKFNRLRPIVGKIIDNPVSMKLLAITPEYPQFGRMLTFSAYEHYINKEYIANPDAMLFSVYEDYRGSWKDEISIAQLAKDWGISQHENEMRKMARGLSVNYPQLISYSDSLNLDCLYLKALNKKQDMAELKQGGTADKMTLRANIEEKRSAGEIRAARTHNAKYEGSVLAFGEGDYKGVVWQKWETNGKFHGVVAHELSKLTNILYLLQGNNVCITYCGGKGSVTPLEKTTEKQIER